MKEANFKHFRRSGDTLNTNVDKVDGPTDRPTEAQDIQIETPRQQTKAEHAVIERKPFPILSTTDL